MDNLLALIFIAALVCLVLGLIRPTIFRSLFKEKTSRKRVTYVFGGTMIASLVLLAAVLPPVEKQPTGSASSDASTQQVVTEPVTSTSPVVAASQPVATEPPPQPIPTKAPEPSEEDRLSALVQETFKGTSNTKKERLRKVDIVKQVGGGWGVFIEYNASENLTTNMTKKGIESDMSKAYIALYTADLNVKQATVAAYFPLRDQYGNNEDGIVYKTTLTSEVADKINWQAENITLQARIIPGLWKTSILNVSFR